jgi:hypothetical protein
MIGPFMSFVPGRRFSSRKHQSAGSKINLVMPLDHENLELRRIAKQEHGGRWDRIDGLRHGHQVLQ